MTEVRASAVHRVQARLSHVAEQFPLFETRPSLRGLRTAPSVSPGAVFVGVGVASGRQVSRALPFDALGLLLGAEQVRRASGAPELVVLVADAHALAHHASSAAVRERARSYEQRLRWMAAACRLPSVRVLRATDLHAQDDYRGLLRDIERRAPANTAAYVTREVADIAHLERTYGGLVKVGWALQASARGALRDERLFDGRFREWVGGSVGFVYTKAGRALDDTRHKVPPYLAWNRARRVCLEPGENVAEKLAYARAHTSEATYRGVCNHLRAISRTYAKLVRPLTGSVVMRTQAIVDDLLAAEGTQADPPTNTTSADMTSAVSGPARSKC